MKTITEVTAHIESIKKEAQAGILLSNMNTYCVYRETIGLCDDLLVFIKDEKP